MLPPGPLDVKIRLKAGHYRLQDTLALSSG